MTTGAEARASVAPLEAGLRHLVRIAGAIAGSPEGQVRSLMSEAIDEVDPVSVEEIILQSYLFAGFPRTLNAMRAWRSVSERPAPDSDPEAAAEDFDRWRTRGTETCAIVYGESYEKLRQNIRELHPALDEWMIVDGYGKVLSRPGWIFGRASCASSRRARCRGSSGSCTRTSRGVECGIVGGGDWCGSRRAWGSDFAG